MTNGACSQTHLTCLGLCSMAAWKLNGPICAMYMARQLNKWHQLLNSACCLTIKGNLWHSPKSNTIRCAHKRNPYHVIEFYRYWDVNMGAMASQITSPTSVYTIVSGAYQRKHQSSASLAFVWGIHRWPMNSPHKGPVSQKMFPFDDVIMHFSYYSHRTIISLSNDYMTHLYFSMIPLHDYAHLYTTCILLCC